MDLAGLVDLPWNRVGVWAVVVWFMYSLKDFFGVSCILTALPCSASLVVQVVYLCRCLQNILSTFLSVQIAMGTFILSFIGNGFVKSAQRARLFPPQISPQIRRKILVS